ncbi:DoxX family protein [Nocardioides panzhihuensis]|uniref:Putative membrane protein n=1 Tax=Nocardioides panzhihuensis TaxID=860243 RepID=A0A7Z0IRK7_9ACTN|nr:MauE/DoxX family redox-associated membrane protein [Nocardioides panzhihuensis]NYI76908.1 putative membrane protein [Nocardioides panzhihuensis]
MSLAVTVVAWILAALLLVVGVAHLAAPGKVEPLVPEWWPSKRLTVYVSGLAEVAIGIGLLVPVTRPWAAGVAVLIFLAYTLVHLDDLRHTSGATRFGDTTGGVVTRGVVNLAYAGLAVFVLLG